MLASQSASPFITPPFGADENTSAWYSWNLVSNDRSLPISHGLGTVSETDEGGDAPVESV